MSRRHSSDARFLASFFIAGVYAPRGATIVQAGATAGVLAFAAIAAGGIRSV